MKELHHPGGGGFYPALRAVPPPHGKKVYGWGGEALGQEEVRRRNRSAGQIRSLRAHWAEEPPRCLLRAIEGQESWEV